MSKFDSYCCLASIATPYAPINPEISGLTTFLPTIFSKALKTASL